VCACGGAAARGDGGGDGAEAGRFERGEGGWDCAGVAGEGGCEGGGRDGFDCEGVGHGWSAALGVVCEVRIDVGGCGGGARWPRRHVPEADGWLTQPCCF